MVVVAFAPVRSPRATALQGVLAAALGPPRVASCREEAFAALAETPGAVLLLDLRDADAAMLTEATVLCQQAAGRRTLLLRSPNTPRSLACDAVLTAPFYYDEVVGWCNKAQSAPPPDSVLADLAQGLSHEVLNPLTAVMMQVQLLRTQIDTPSVSESLQRIDESHRRIQDIVQEVRAASEPRPVAAVPARLDQVLDSACARLAHRDRGLAQRVQVQCTDETVTVQADLVSGALADLWNWMLWAGREQDLLAVEAGPTDAWAVTIRSRAPVPRLPDDAAARLFTPLWARQALGLTEPLSLTSARSVFLRHSGNMLASAQREGSLTVDAILPRNCNPVQALLP